METNKKHEETQFKCTGDCLNCNRVQREYCGAQKGYDNQRLLLSLQESVRVLSGTIEELRDKIEAIQDNEAMVFDPKGELLNGVPEIPTSHEIAQEGDGAGE